MVAHWWRLREKPVTSLLLKGIGACATAATLIVIITAKFREGAWLVLVVLPPVIAMFLRVRKYQTSVDVEVESCGPLDFTELPSPIVVIPLKRLDSVGKKALRLALRLTPDVQAVQVLSEAMKTQNLQSCWNEAVMEPAVQAGYEGPKLVVLRSEYREFFGPFLDHLGNLAKLNPDRPIGVMIPELVEKRWYHFFFRHRATWLKGLILMRGGPQIFIINTPWYVEPNTTPSQATSGADRPNLSERGTRSPIRRTNAPAGSFLKRVCGSRIPGRRRSRAVNSKA
jgi:hypothetical protein